MENLKNKILKEIESKKIEPTSKSYFSWIERIKWTLIWIFIFLSILFISFLLDDTVELFMAWPKVFRWFPILIFLPHLIWIILIAAAIFFIIKEFRSTKTGYRYSLWLILGMCALVFLLWQFLFFRIWLWPSMHWAFVDWIPFAKDMIYNESSWNNPKEWKIAWKVKEIWKNYIIVETKDSKKWKIDTKEAYVWLNIKFKVGSMVRVIWETQSWSSIIASKVLPWFGRWWDMFDWRERKFPEHDDLLPPPGDLNMIQKNIDNVK